LIRSLNFTLAMSFGNWFCPARRRHVFRAPSRALSCGGCIIGSSAAICAKACSRGDGPGGGDGRRNSRRRRVRGPEWPSCACRAYFAVSIWPSRGIRGRSTALSACGMLPRCAGPLVFIVWKREILELNFVIQRIFCVFSKVCGLALNIFLAHVSQFYHIVSEGTWRFRRPAPTKINHDGS
jgi:hypothetical protein